MLLFIALVQPAPVPPQRIDLTQAPLCAPQATTDEDVIVCGRRGDESSRYRIPPLASPPAKDGKAQWQVGKGTSVSAETEQVDVGGTPSNRVMLRLKFKF